MFEEKKMNPTEEMSSMEEYEVYDGCYGIVEGSCRSGSYLKLDNGEDAFAFKFTSLRKGTKVLCTVLRLASEGRDKLVSIDSIVEYADAA
ncbi:MAG: hypothetical protein IJ412_07500 [Oscillospiraceae bacterium]|nr:hypothetical protein [Oscillospiraceae bacterium]